MNPGLFLITRNTFYLHLQVFLFLALIKSENRKTFLLVASTIQNPKTTLQLPLHLAFTFALHLVYLLHSLHITFSYYHCI